MKRSLTIVAAVVLAVLLAGSAVAQMGPGPQVPMGPEQMGKMMEMMAQMQEQMKQMREHIQGAPGMGPMEGRMAQMTQMMGQMRGMMAQHQEMIEHACPGAASGQAPR